MRLIALLSWFDEPIEDLVACITSAQEHGVDHVVAVDGKYALYPADEHVSDSRQHAAVVLACRQLGLGLTLHVPAAEWAGGEVEKRTFHFALAHAVSQPGDWFWIMDADEIVVKTPPDLKDRLRATELDCADIEAEDAVAVRLNLKDMPERFSVRHLFRAQPITVVTNHITYVSGDGRLLWGYAGGDQPLEDALDLTEDVLIEHHPDRRRSRERLLAKYQYYAQRNAEKVERGPCDLCGEPAVELLPTRWRMTGIGPVADWMEACAVCRPKVETVNRITLEQMGINPDSVVAENRMGRAPQATAA